MNIENVLHKEYFFNECTNEIVSQDMSVYYMLDDYIKRLKDHDYLAINTSFAKITGSDFPFNEDFVKIQKFIGFDEYIQGDELYVDNDYDTVYTHQALRKKFTSELLAWWEYDDITLNEWIDKYYNLVENSLDIVDELIKEWKNANS